VPPKSVNCKPVQENWSAANVTSGVFKDTVEVSVVVIFPFNLTVIETFEREEAVDEEVS